MRTFEIKQRTKRRHFTSLFRFELAHSVPVRAVGAGPVARGGGDVDITDDKLVAEPFVQDPPYAFRHLVLVQFMVSGCDYVVRDVGEQVEGRGGTVGEWGGGFGVDEAVAVDAVAGVDEEEVDAESAGVLLETMRERVKVWVQAGGQGGRTGRIGGLERGGD